MKKTNISLVLAVSAFVGSIITFCICYTNFKLPYTDTGSFLVTVLAVLVTVLMSWQIYNVIQVQKELEKFKTLLDNNEKKLLNRIGKVKGSQEKALIKKKKEDRKKLQMLSDILFNQTGDILPLLNAIFTAGKFNINNKTDRDTINIILKSFTEILEKISDEDRKIILDLIEELPEERKSLEGIRFIYEELDIIPILAEKAKYQTKNE